jgi:hypothetical protein
MVHFSNGFIMLPPTAPMMKHSVALDMGFTKTGGSNIFDLPDDGMTGTGQKRSRDLYEADSKTGDHSSFLVGDELHLHRQKVLLMRQDLDQARNRHQTKRVRRLTKAILAAQEQDAEFMYQVSLERMEAAQQAGLAKEAARYKQSADRARAALPQFQLEGLWVGRYGDSFQMVNVSYVGDLLVAHKVTGTQSGYVPRGEVSFQVDLSPANDLTLDPIELKSEAAELWGSRYLQRHTGLGQVAGQGYIQSQWLEGQLILVNRQYFSFAWLPTGHQVFFGRPGPDLTLKLMRQQEASVRGQKNGNDHRQYLERCLEATDDLDDELETSDGLFRSHDQGFYFDQEGCFD